MTMFVEHNVPVPEKTLPPGREKSELRLAVEALTHGTCLTVLADDETHQRRLVKKLVSVGQSAKKAHPHQPTYLTRQVYAEHDGKIHPAARIWRTG